MLKAKNEDYVKDIHFDSGDEFLKSISYGGELYDVFNKDFIFRGHSSDDYELLPTALRDYLYRVVHPTSDINEKNAIYAVSEFGQIDSEARLLYNFYTKCDDTHLFIPSEKRFQSSYQLGVDYQLYFTSEKWIAEEYQELAALAQHHGVPTRLLDWTFDINVALYFASSSVLKKMAQPKTISMKTLDAYCEKLKEDIKRGKDTCKDNKIEIWALDANIARVSIDKEYIPLRIIKPRYYSNNNLAAQKGVFTYWEVTKPIKLAKDGRTMPDISIPLNKDTLDVQIVKYLERHSVEKKIYIYRITVPQSAAADLYVYAKKNHCDASYLFPGYNGVVRCMEEDRFAEKMKVHNAG